MQTIQNTEIKLLLNQENYFTPIRLLFRKFHCKPNSAFLFPDDKRGHRYGFTYLRIPKVLRLYLASTLVWCPLFA